MLFDNSGYEKRIWCIILYLVSSFCNLFY
jgi:hypothetical protein